MRNGHGVGAKRADGGPSCYLAVRIRLWRGCRYRPLRPVEREVVTALARGVSTALAEGHRLVARRHNPGKGRAMTGARLPLKPRLKIMK